MVYYKTLFISSLDQRPEFIAGVALGGAALLGLIFGVGRWLSRRSRNATKPIDPETPARQKPEPRRPLDERQNSPKKSEPEPEEPEEEFEEEEPEEEEPEEEEEEEEEESEEEKDANAPPPGRRMLMELHRQDMIDPF